MSNVDHPNHYQSESGLEVIDVIKAFTSELSGEEAFCIGNAIKYICRYSKKNGTEDLEKAKWYIDRVISVRNTEFLKTPEPTADVKHYESSTDNIGSFLFASREDANNVVKELQSMIYEHGYVTLADLHDMCELAIPSPEYKDIGWKSADAFRIIPSLKQTGDCWQLVFNERPRRIEED